MQVTPHLLLRAYAQGLFPMAESRDAPSLYWIDPERRGVLPLDEFHLPRRLRRTVRSRAFEIRCDTAFDTVIEGCAAAGPSRRESWINDEIRRLYGALFRMGHVHTVECWRDDGLAGGLYGVTLGGAFFGESMFSRERDASKVALVHLVARLRLGGFRLLDTQFTTAHLERFGAREIARADYRALLAAAVATDADFRPDLSRSELDAFLHSSTQMS
ncbi:MAG: leucyl/phenylalanyl-tRNA--protein transferase [Alphaproteobacteria bacterium]|nr:leucyl/phenylalanyl-tRNA--protein transferase [Alphaproteobacteria bacterium]